MSLNLQSIITAGIREELAEKLTDAFDLEKVQELTDFYRDNNERGGFFSKGDKDRIFERHILESMVFADAVRDYVSRETEILDVATGPGLPGSVFLCRGQPVPVTFLDSSRRRLSILENDGPAFIAERAKFIYQRAEDLTGHFPVIVSRAFIPFPFCLLPVHHLQKPGDLYLPFLSTVDRSPESDQIVKQAGYSIEAVTGLTELAFLGKRSVAVLRKERTVHKGKPYRWKYIKDLMT